MSYRRDREVDNRQRTAPGDTCLSSARAWIIDIGGSNGKALFKLIAAVEDKLTRSALIRPIPMPELGKTKPNL